jgi:hypothetical protein
MASCRGMNLEEREAAREKYRTAALASAARMGVTVRCRDLPEGHPDHQMCRGEDPNGTGCLCKCHDTESNRVVTEYSRGSARGLRHHPELR